MENAKREAGIAMAQGDMSKRRYRKRHVARRDSKIIVRTCRWRVMERVCIVAVVVPFALVLGTILIHLGRPVRAALVLWVLGIVPVFTAFLWKWETGKIVLTLDANGVNYFGQLIRWSHIASVEIHDASPNNRELVIVQRNGCSVTVVDDYLDHSLDMLRREMERRVGTPTTRG